MAINLENVEDISELESVRILRQENCEVLFKNADAFNGCVKDLMTDIESLTDCVKTKDLVTILSNIRNEVDYLGREIGVNVNIDSQNMNNVLVPLIGVGISCVLMYERLMNEVKKADELKKQEQERLQEYDDLECAKPIFAMLKKESKKWEWGDDFDEYTISHYIAEMVELGKKHNVDLGIDKAEEIPTTLETLEENKERKE